MTPTRRAAGFTLLEMLVALVVFGLVMAGLTQTFRFGLTAWSAEQRNGGGTETLAAVDTVLINMIGQIRPGTLTGHGDQLAMTTRLPLGAGLGTNLADAALELAPNGALVLSFALHPPGIPLIPLPAPQSEIVQRGLTGLTISYYGRQAGAAASWSNNWAGNSLPLLIRIHCAFANHRNWPDLIAAPVAGGN